MSANIKEIEQLLQQWAYNTRVGNLDEILNSHAEATVFFDVLSPMQYQGKKQYRQSWDEWQPQTKGDFIFDLHDISIRANQDLAFAYCLIHCGGTLANGQVFDDWVRATFCLEKKGQKAKWLITHQHISMPQNRQ